MVNSLAPNTEPCGTPDVTGRLCERESPTQTWLFVCLMYDWNHLKAGTGVANLIYPHPVYPRYN